VPNDSDPPESIPSPVRPTVDPSGANAPGHGHPIHTQCQNCSTELRGSFCHHCGQHDFDVHRSFGHVILEALENFFHFDEKFFRNVVTLLFRPGRLSADFNAGKRASQMPPFRLYLFISVLFFFVIALGSHQDAETKPVVLTAGTEKRAVDRTELSDALLDLARSSPDPATKQRLESTARRLADPAVTNAELTEQERRDVPAGFLRQFKKQFGKGEFPSAAPVPEQARSVGAESGTRENSELERFLTEKGRYALDHEEEMRESFTHSLPKMLVICLPLMALYARVLFRRSGTVYLQQLIIALHYHTFVYLWWMVSQGWHELIGLRFQIVADLLSFGSWVWMVFYPFLMFRHLFGEAWWRTILKTLALALGYMVTIGLGFLATAIIVFLSL